MNSWLNFEQDASLICQKWLSFDEVWIDPWVSLLSHGKAVGKLFSEKMPRWGWWIVARVLVLIIIQIFVLYLFHWVHLYDKLHAQLSWLLFCREIPRSWVQTSLRPNFFFNTCFFHFYQTSTILFTYQNFSFWDDFLHTCHLICLFCDYAKKFQNYFIFDYFSFIWKQVIFMT